MYLLKLLLLYVTKQRILLLTLKKLRDKLESISYM